MLAYIPVNLANIIVSFGTIAVLTRLLSPAEFGTYALAVVTVQFVHMGLFTWLEAAMQRFLARAEREGDVNSHIKTLYAYALGVFLCVCSVILLGLYFSPLDNGMKILFGFALMSGCLSIFFNLGMEAHKAAHRIGRFSATFTVQKLLSFSIGIILILATPLREAAPFIGIISATLLVLIIDIPFMVRRMKGGKIETEKIKTYFKFGMPICISLLLTYTLSSGDIYMITAMMDESWAGKYNAGYNLANRTVEVLFVWVAMAVTPMAVTALEHKGTQEAQVILRGYCITLMWLILPAATGIALVSDEAGFILGESVRDEASNIMPWIAFSGVLNGMISYYAHRAFLLSGKTDMFVWAMVPPVILNIALNFYLIPIYGIMGAVVATVASYGLGLIISIIIGRKYYPLPLPAKEFIHISLACVAMAVIVKITPIPKTLPDFWIMSLKGIVGILSYGLICYLTNTANTRDVLRGIVGKFSARAEDPVVNTKIG